MKEALSRFPLPWMPTLAMMIFFALFVLLIVRVSLKRRQPILRAAAALPLEEGEKYE